MSPVQQKAAINEFNMKKGVAVATLSGVMSACFAYGLAAGDPIKSLTLKHGTPVLWQGLPVLVVVLLGGFTTNFIWCVMLNIRNKTGYQYVDGKSREANSSVAQAPMLSNYLFSALAGTTWYFQFFFYSMGET